MRCDMQMYHLCSSDTRTSCLFVSLDGNQFFAGFPLLFCQKSCGMIVRSCRLMIIRVSTLFI